MAAHRMLTPSGRPYPRGTLTAKVYVLKDTDEWLTDECETGAIWSGGLGKIKSNQHLRRFILDEDGIVLRPPLAGPGSVPPTGISADAVKAAQAIGRLQIGDSLRQYLLRSLIRQITPDKPAYTTRKAQRSALTTHGDHVVMCWVTAKHISRKGVDVEG